VNGGRTVWHRLDLFLARWRPYRQPLSLAIDAAVVWAAWNATYLFRLGFERWFSARAGYDGWVIAGIVVAYVAAFVAFKVPQGLWRFAGFGEVRRLTWAIAVAGVASAAVVMGLGLVKVPRSVLALHPVVALMGVVLVRIAYRMLYEHARQRISGSGREIRRALVLGAGQAARQLLAGIQHQGWIVLGLLDDDPAKQGTRVGDVPVLGPLAALRDPRRRGAATHLILALPSATPVQRREALALAAEAGLPVLTVPTLDELQGRPERVERLREVEAGDLLGRAPVQLDEAGLAAALGGRTVLVTGAGGSIGSELCRQVARWRPARLLLLELSEFNLYTIDQALAEAQPGLPREALIGDVRDADGLRRVFERWRPQVVLHAAALKHVPLVERGNAWAALATNTLGSWQVARAAAEAGAERFVLVSTDKAVNPTNVMGASKRLAEMALADLAARHPATCFVAVRFGNVLGSSGSVIPRFKEQIARGGPVTVTHPEMTRYFMTIPEAARLVLQAGAAGASGQVMVLDMGEPVKIVDLARQLIRLAGHAPEEIGIEVTGLRPGEKLYEELLADADATLPTELPRILRARLSDERPDMPAVMDWIQTHAHAADAEVRDFLASLLPEYRPAPAGDERGHVQMSQP
jgi:FlaA1/EpsC-like NDP-sugar epimerase